MVAEVFQTFSQEIWERLDTCDTCDDTCHVALQMEAEIITIYWRLARFILITRCPGPEPHLTPRRPAGGGRVWAAE